MNKPVVPANSNSQNVLKATSSVLSNIWFFCLMFLSLTSVGLIVTYIAELITGTVQHGVSSQLGLIVFLCGIVYAGYVQLQKRLNERSAVRELQEEQAILNRAKMRGGIVTVSEMALESQLRISDIKRAFERLALTSVCHIDVTEDGEICYRFPSFERKAALSKSALMMDTTFETIDSSEKIKLNVEQ